MNEGIGQFNNSQYDLDRFTQYFLINLMLLLIFGIIMVYSASYIYAKELYGSSVYFLLRQIGFSVIGMGLAFTVGKTKFAFWFRYGQYIHIFIIFLLLLTLLPGMGSTVKGASRWLNLGVFKIQPGELCKYTIMITALYFFENFEELDLQEKIKHFFLLSAPLGLLLLQPDYGSFVICFFVIILVCFLSSFPRKYFYAVLAGGILVGVLALFLKAYRIQRLFTFLDPWRNPKTSGFQIIQSYLAFANGSWFGQGLGNSNEKLFYLPEAHNDFIFSVVGEELGFLGVIMVILIFISLVYWGLRVALSTSNKISLILVSSIVLMIGFQALLNMGVVLGLLPTKGLNLPFVSYGGSSLVANFFGIGLILSAVRYSKGGNDV